MLALELKKISKTFGSHRALDQVDLSIRTGEVHAILGENGAGKSTLMKIIFGLYHPDPHSESEIFLKGTKINMTSARVAIKSGIGMVHQHFMLVRPFTVLQNIILGIEPRTAWGSIDYKKAREEVTRLSETYNFNIDLDSKIENISVGMQQRVEILKTLYRHAEIIILDEPTAVLTPQEVTDFYRIIRRLKSVGKTIIIITHKLHEIKEIADRCTIIRKGKFIETVDVDSATEEELASKMVGRTVELAVTKKSTNVGAKVLDVSALCVLNDKGLPAVKDLHLELKRGEILGLAGIDGNGQRELAEALTGLRKIESGSVTIKGHRLNGLSPKEIYEHKISMIPEDRQLRGLVMNFSVKENFVLQNIKKAPFSTYGIIINRELENFASNLIDRFDIRPRNLEIDAGNLSGGNQQKIILAREIANNPDVLIAFQPTRGLDVGAIEYIHQEIIKLRDQQKAVLLISYELDEVINLSDRIAVMAEGAINAEISTTEIETIPNIKEHVGLFMAGGKK